MSRREKTPFRMEPFRVDDELHRSIRVENREDAASTVPLEEALLLDSAEQRRKLILSVLTDDPVQYYDLLEQARLNDDSEVVHYAATAMAQISKQADAALQRHAARFAADPKAPAVLAEYAAALEASLALGLAQGRAAQLQRQQLERLLKMQLADQPKEEQYGLGCRLAKVQLELAEYAAAEQTLAELTARWPVRERRRPEGRGRAGPLAGRDGARAGLPERRRAAGGGFLEERGTAMRRLRSWFLRFRWQKLLVVWLVFGLMAAALFAERSGVQYTGTHLRLNLLDTGLTKEEAATGETPTCLLLCDSTVDGGDEARAQFEQLLLDMKVPTAVADLAEEEVLPAFENYQTVVVLVADLDTLGLRLLDLMDWVEQGGNVLFAMTLEKSGAFDTVAQKLGVLSSSWSNKVAESIVPAAGFMLGGGQRYELSDPFESALGVRLRDDATVYAVTGDKGVPLVWSTELGKGRIVVDNIGVYDKVMRGFYAASYSLLGDACAYPVLNSAVFFLDDFPSPVPEGDGQYIRQQYGLSIAEFYAKVWWPDLVRLAERYGIRYTGAMIENYGDDTEAPPTRQRNIRQFQYYGGLLLRQGGELGFHGYNHQPLVLPETDYGDRYDYRQWPSADAIVAAMDELTSFQKAVLPYASGSVYVPPSNILSASGRAILGSRVPQVRTIASSYLEDGTDLPYVQEFGVAEDGVVEEPRIVSGSMVGDTYMRTAALSELNLHFVSTHFMHPDDLLDVDRGAAEGWEVYKTGLEDYLEWLTAAAPALRMQTASECAGAIQRFSALTVRLESEADAWTLRLGNFADEAWLLFRANGGTPGSVSGGELTHLTGNLYLLRADAPIVTMERKEK